MSSRTRPLLDRLIWSASALWIGLLPNVASGEGSHHSSDVMSTGSRSGNSRASRPYLAVILAPPLRFALPASAPAELPRLPSLEPIVRAAAPDVTAAAAPATPAPESTGATSAPTVEPPVPDPERMPAPVRILRDDTPRELRAVDFLPYFVFPGSSDPGVPPSSATYRQR